MPVRRVSRSWNRCLLIGVVAAAGCGGAVEHLGPDGGPAGDASPPGPVCSKPGEVPKLHRPNDSQCLQPSPAGSCKGGGGAAAACHVDSDCKTGSNGRCEPLGCIAGCTCSYDTCSSDKACPTGKVCACHGSIVASNTCLPGNCRVDSDCGSKGYCSPSSASDNLAYVGYYCHTPKDECVSDSDCTDCVDASASPGIAICAWSSASARWTCQTQPVCG